MEAKKYKEFAEGMLDLIKIIDPSLVHRIMLFSEGLNIPVSDVIQNLLIDQWARTAAEASVAGGVLPRTLPEFTWEVSDDGSRKVITGEPLFKHLVAHHKQELIDQEQALEGIQKAYQEVLRKYLATSEGKAELEKDTQRAGEQAVNIEELQRRQRDAELEANTELTARQKQISRRDNARQDAYERKLFEKRRKK